MIVSVGDQQLRIPAGQTQRVLQTHAVSRSVFVSKIEKVAADQCMYFAVWGQIDGPNDVGFGV